MPDTSSYAFGTRHADRRTYRPDIDGLRAVAVLAVVFYHFGIPGFTAGLVGVDMFFVVSGFVITKLLWSGFTDGSLTLMGFYERRIRRLMPALLAMLAACSVVAFMLQLPYDFELFSKSLVAALLCVSNIFFARQHGDYFAPDAAAKPLLHTWSLGVEEQFYLLYPLLLAAILRHAPTPRPSAIRMIVAALVMSLALACVGGVFFPAAAFFLLPTRVWELMLGALLALAVFPDVASRARQAMGLAGAALVAASISDSLPSLSAFVPQPLFACLGTAMLIHAGTGAGTVMTAVLSRPVMVVVGRMSYSLYLWHWPVLVFYRLAVSRTLGAWDIAVILAVTTLLGVASWTLIEEPMRRRRALPGRIAALAVCIAAALPLGMAGLLGAMTHGLPGRLPPDVVRLDSAKNDINPKRFVCIGIAPEQVIKDPTCRVGRGRDVAPSFMVWGDSHADPWMPVFDDIAREAGTSGLILARGGCPPLLGIRRVSQPGRGQAPECLAFNEAALAAVKRFGIRRVLLVGRWSWYLQGTEGEAHPDPEGAIIARIGDSDTEAETSDNRRRAFREGMAATVARLRAMGAEIWLINEPPAYPVEVPKLLASAALRGTADHGHSPEAVRQLQAFQAETFRENGLSVLDVASHLCPAGRERCAMQEDGHSLYSDANHLSVFGARYMARHHDLVMRRIVGRPVGS